MIDTVETIRHLTAEAIAKGHAHMILAVTGPLLRRRRLPPERIAIAPGLKGRWMGDIDEPDKRGYIVDVLVSDAVAWLQRRGVTVEVTPPNTEADTEPAVTADGSGQ